MKILVNNRKAAFDYNISNEMIAGLVLSGSEVKSLKASQASLKGAYISIRHSPNPEAYLVKAHITPYKYAGIKNPDPEKERKLLLNKKEISSLIGKEKGTVIIPLEIFVGTKGLIKLKIGVGKGKKKYDKRSSIKKREIERRIKRQED